MMTYRFSCFVFLAQSEGKVYRTEQEGMDMSWNIINFILLTFACYLKKQARFITFFLKYITFDHYI